MVYCLRDQYSGFSNQGKLSQYNGITRNMVVQAVAQFCFTRTKIQPTSVVMLDDYPYDRSNALRHACINGGIQNLVLNTFSYPVYNKQGMLYSYMTVHFYFCVYCGKLLIIDSFFKM